MTGAELVQGTQDWIAARCGSLGASAVAEVIAKTKSGYGAGRTNAKARIIAERLSGNPEGSFTNAAMQWGIDQEDTARKAYAYYANIDVVEVGLIVHPMIMGTHASPDGLVGDAGLIEIKCPNTATHIETLKSKSVAGKYVTQMQWQMACTGRQWCDFVSFDPRMPDDMQLFVTRVDRDDAMIAELENEVRAFLAEVEADIDALTAEYRKEAA